MATYHAIAATGEAIIALLRAACPKPEFANAQFVLYQASDFQNPMDEGISLYLYRISVNTTIRNRRPRLGPDGRRYPPSFPVDLHYLLTPWAKTAGRQQRLLGWAVRALEDTPILPRGLLNHGPDSETFLPNETVELVCDILSLQDIVNIWDAFKPNLQVSMPYVARMIAIDSTVELSEAPFVQTRAFGLEKELV
jgi:Pvc16 N-terminal domain